MNDDPTTTAETQTETTAPDNPQEPDDDLRVVDWLSTSDPELELDADDMETVGDVRQVIHDTYISDIDYKCWSPAIFGGADGRAYAVEIGVIVRPATLEEVREAVEEVRAATLDTAMTKAKRLDGYLSASAT